MPKHITRLSTTATRSPLTEFDKAVIYVTLKERELTMALEALAEVPESDPAYRNRMDTVHRYKTELSSLKKSARRIEADTIAVLAPKTDDLPDDSTVGDIAERVALNGSNEVVETIGDVLAVIDGTVKMAKAS